MSCTIFGTWEVVNKGDTLSKYFTFDLFMLMSLHESACSFPRLHSFSGDPVNST